MIAVLPHGHRAFQLRPGPARPPRLARQLARDPYSLEFLGLTAEAAGRDLQQALTERIVETLRELGPGYWHVALFISAEFAEPSLTPFAIRVRIAPKKESPAHAKRFRKSCRHCT